MSAKPENKADLKLSKEHLKDTIAFNNKHIKDHKDLMRKGGSKKYNEKHIKKHEKLNKKAKKELEDRNGMKLRKAMRQLPHG